MALPTIERDEHDQRADGVRDDVAREDAGRLEADDDRGLHIFLRTLHEHETVREPREFRPPDDQHGDDGVGRADAERGRDGERQDDRREAQDEVGEAHDQLFAAPAHEGGGAAEERAEGRADDHHHEAGDERDAAAVEQARQHVASELVRAEPMGWRRRAQPKGHIDRVRRVGGEIAGRRARSRIQARMIAAPTAATP